MSRKERAMKGTIASFLQYILLIGMQFFLSPLILRYAGQETLGVYAILAQVIGNLALVDLGFWVSFNRFLSQSFGYEDNGKSFEEVLSIGRTFLLGTNFVFAFACILLSFFIGKLIGLTNEIEPLAKLCLILLGVWAIIRSPLVIFGSVLNATQDLAFRNLISALEIIIRLVLSIIFIYVGFGLLGIVIANILAEAIDLIICWRRFEYLHSNYKIFWGIPNLNLFKHMVKFGVQVLVINVAVRLIYYTDNIIVGTLFGAITSSIYYSTQMPASICWTMINRISDNASPAINELTAKVKYTNLRQAYLDLQRYTFILGLILATGLILFNKSMITLWVGISQYGGDIMNFELAIYAFLVTVVYVSDVFVIALGRIKWLSFYAICEGILHLIFAIILGKLFGLSGIILGGILASLPKSGYLLYRSHHDLSIPLTKFFRESFFPAIITLIPGIIFGFTMNQVWRELNWPQFVFITFTFLFIETISIWIFALTKMERIKIIGFIKKIRKDFKFEKVWR